MSNFINEKRLWSLLMELGEITEPERPYTRRSFSKRFLEGRAWLEQQMQNAGLETRIDSAGNLIGLLRGNGKKSGVIAIGSHSDSVPNGGRFDGIAGVISALECVLSWRERGIAFNHDIEIIDYLAEEPSEWGISCIGSRGITGFLNNDLLAIKHPQTQETLAEAINRMGGKSDALQIRDDIAAAFELHIEQGQVLETEALDVGIVSGIVGIRRIAIELQGQANHAGTTPMHLRQDALNAAAEIILNTEHLAQEFSQGSAYFVATCGQIFAEPNASNVIVGDCRIVFDIRSDDDDLLAKFSAELEKFSQKISHKRNVSLAIKTLSSTKAVKSASQLMDILTQAANNQALKQKIMPSGAGHDAAFLSHIAPMVMLFVPSKDGKSHCPEEWTTAEELAHGASVLCEAVEIFDKNN